MDKRTKFKVTIITIVGVFVTLIYINRGQLIREFQFTKRQIEWEKDEPKGQLVNGHKTGEWKTYFKNGQLARVENYKNDTLDGKQIWYTPDGYYDLRANYSMGVKVDSFFMYSGKGRLNSVEFRDSLGRNQGPFKIYYSNGQLSQTGQYKDGEFDGEFRTFYDNGQLKSIENYLLGKRTGMFVELSQKGDTIKVQRY